MPPVVGAFFLRAYRLCVKRFVLAVYRNRPMFFRGQ